MTQNDFLSGAEFYIAQSPKWVSNIFYYCFGAKKGFVSNDNKKRTILEIDKEGVCIDYNGAPRRIEFSDCKMIENDTE